jgi:protein-S-isoprenylcysteine O-methyltransferase Ste14
MSKPRKFQRYRILLSRFVALALMALLLFSQKQFLFGKAELIGYWLGFLLLIFCSFGRLWSLQYLTGFKTKTVIDVGPFSLMRNPLYLFSFSGVLGFVLVANHLWFALIALAAYVFYYPFVIFSEEKHLRDELGEEFSAYCGRVNRFLPSFTHYKEPERHEIMAKKFSKVYLDVVWFLVGFMLLSFLLKAHTAALLPILF